MLIKLISASATKPASKKKPKKVVVPKSVAYAVEKTKGRLVKAVPGRYIIKNRKGMFVVVRFKEETRFSPSVGQKLFSVSGSPEPDFIGLETFESQSAPQPGARNASVGNKLGKKTHSKGMMAAGWWMFSKKADGKLGKVYIGGRISGRRLLGLLDPSKVKSDVPNKEKATEKKTETRSTRPIKPNKAVTTKRGSEPESHVQRIQREDRERREANNKFASKKAAELKNYGVDMYTLSDAIVVAQTDTTKLEEAVAGKAHAAWAAQFRKDNPGVESRVKETKDADWIKANGTNKVDILNTKFKDLPSDWKAENLKGAQAAIGAFKSAGKEISKGLAKDKNMDISKPLERASAVVHKKWLERNGAWAQDDQKVAYSKLSEVEKQKDRDFISHTIKVLSAAR